MLGAAPETLAGATKIEMVLLAMTIVLHPRTVCLQGLLGHFINLIPVRVQLEPEDSFVALVLKVAQVGGCVLASSCNYWLAVSLLVSLTGTLPICAPNNSR